MTRINSKRKPRSTDGEDALSEGDDLSRDPTFDPERDTSRVQWLGGKSAFRTETNQKDATS